MELKINTVLLGYDFSDGATQAARVAMWLTERTGAELHVLNALPMGVNTAWLQKINTGALLDPLEVEAIGLEHLSDIIERELSKVNANDLPLAVDVAERPVAPMLLDQAHLLNADLIVVGAVGHEAAHDVPVGTDTFRLVRASMWPVLVCKRDQAFPPRRILTPVDMSEASARALGWGVDFARMTGAPLTVLHVAYNAEDPSVKEFEQFMDEADTSRADVTTLVRFGDPPAEIVRVAKEINAEMMTIGTLGRSRIMEVLIGGTSERILRALPCSLLMIKPDEFVFKFKLAL